MFPQTPVRILHLSYSGLNRQLCLPYHFASQFRPPKVIRSLVASHFLAGAAEVVDAPLNCTVSCQCALWSLRPFQLSSLWRWSCDGKSTRIARPPSRTTAYRVVKSIPVNVLPVQPFHSLPFSLLFPLLLVHFYLGKVINILLGISEGSCINPFQGVGGPRLFSQKILKYPSPAPPPNKKRTFPKNLPFPKLA